MRKTFPILLCLLVLLACRQKKADAPVIKSLIIGDPLECGISQTLLLPVGTSFSEETRKEDISTEISETRKNILYFSKNTVTEEFNDRWAQVEYVNENVDDFDIRNILFYDLPTGVSRTLSSDTFHILSFAIHHEFQKPLIFYRVVRSDYNGDKKYNNADPVMLYISNLNGDSLVQVTSDKQKFVDYFYYPVSTELDGEENPVMQQKILIKTIVDANGDKKFLSDDETSFLEMDLLHPAAGREIFSGDMKQKLKMQIQL